MSEVTICNLALSHIGNKADVTNINPPDQSAEARKCAVFYPMARDFALAKHHWSFAKRTIALNDLGSPPKGWAYRYGTPTLMIKPVKVTVSGFDLPEPFDLEGDDTSGRVILTNAAQANLTYIKVITDTTVFPPLFELGVSQILASFLAGSIAEKANLADSWLNKGLLTLSMAATTDANSSKVSQVKQNRRDYVPAAIRARK